MNNNRSYFDSIKKGSALALPFFLFLMLIHACKTDGENKSIESKKSINKSEIQDTLQSGDIIVKCGYGYVSNLIIKFLHEETPISHAAIVKKDSANVVVYHSISGEIAENDGVQTISLFSFLNDVKPNSLFILRPKLDSAKIQSVVKNAERLVSKKIPFDHDFELKDTNALYCSEFVQYNFEISANIKCFKTTKVSKTDVYTFNSILNNPDFEVIYKW